MEYNKSNVTNISLDMMIPEVTPQMDYIQYARYFIETIGLTTVCGFGIVGNLMNLAVLTRKQIQRSMQNLEKSANMGLVALAVSDLLFCIFAFPIGLLPRNKYIYTTDEALAVFYSVYVKDAAVSTFIVCSSWLTVVMALARYFAVCKPIHARAFIDVKGTRIAIVSVFLCAILLNLPLFWFYKVVRGLDANGTTIYYMPAVTKYLADDEYYKYMYGYHILTGIFGVVIPVGILAFCNCCLIRELHKSFKLQRECTMSGRRKDTGHGITPTLITIVILFGVLAVPAEIVKWLEFLMATDTSQIVKVITNFLQACNFAINVVLYCVLNVHFRQTVKFIVLCKWRESRMNNELNGRPMTTLMSDMDTDVKTI